jgi:hypothetical protein
MRSKELVTGTVCAEEGSVSVVFSGFTNYHAIIKQRKDAAFFGSFSDIWRNARLIRAMAKKEHKRETLGLRIDSHEMDRLLKKSKDRKSKDLLKVVDQIAKVFKKSTGKKLKYVLLPATARQTIADAFRARKITPIIASVAVNKNLEKFAKADLEGANGVVVVKTAGTKKSGLSKLFKKLKKTGSGMTFKACVGKLDSKTIKAAEKKAAREAAKKIKAEKKKVAKVAAASAKVATASAKAAVESVTPISRSMNALRAKAGEDTTDAATDADLNAASQQTSTAPAAEPVKPKDSSASSVAVSSVFTLALVAAAASFLL